MSIDWPFLWLWLVAMPAFWNYLNHLPQSVGTPNWWRLLLVLAWPAIMTGFCLLWTLEHLGVSWAKRVLKQ